MQERLQKILSRAGIASRRGAEQVMSEGRVTVNGAVVAELGSKADIEQDDIRVDGVRLRPPERPVYLLLNKPKGIVTTRHDPQGRATVMQLVPAVAGLFPVGRLDVTTEGLILLTNDGALAERVAHPRYEVPRVYEAKVHRVPEPDTLARLRRGVRVLGETLAVDEVRVLRAGENNAWLELTLHEGKHHEVRRLLEAVGHPVSKLRRVAIGPLTTRGLEPGEFRHLTPHEVELLRSGARATAPGRPHGRPGPKRGRSGPTRGRSLPRRGRSGPERGASGPKRGRSGAGEGRGASPRHGRPARPRT